jgi:hypothetical protein
MSETQSANGESEARPASGEPVPRPTNAKPESQPANDKSGAANADSDILLARYTQQLAVYTKWLMIAAVLSFLCTAWIAWSTKDLRDFAEIQARDIRTQIQLTHDAVDVATRQAKAVEDANRQAIDTSKRQLRAEVVVVLVETPALPDNDMHIKVHFKNAGQTSAYGLSEYISEDIVPLVEDGQPPFPYSEDSDPYEHPFRTTVGASTEFADQAYKLNKKRYSNGDLLDFKTGRRVYMVWGVVYYKDYSLVDHYLRYCRYFEDGDLGVSDICSAHNESN